MVTTERPSAKRQFWSIKYGDDGETSEAVNGIHWRILWRSTCSVWLKILLKIRQGNLISNIQPQLNEWLIVIINKNRIILFFCINNRFIGLTQLDFINIYRLSLNLLHFWINVQGTRDDHEWLDQITAQLISIKLVVFLKKKKTFFFAFLRFCCCCYV